MCPNSGHTLIVATLWIFFYLIKDTYFGGGGILKQGATVRGLGDSNTWVISYNGGRVPRAALREAVMTKATLTTLRRLNVSGL